MDVRIVHKLVLALYLLWGHCTCSGEGSAGMVELVVFLLVDSLQCSLPLTCHVTVLPPFFCSWVDCSGLNSAVIYCIRNTTCKK